MTSFLTRYLLLKRMRRSMLESSENEEDELESVDDISNEYTDKMCRACAGPGELNIFTPYRARNLASDMQVCAGLRVHPNDGLPAWLCWSCLDILQSFVRFRNMCRESQHRFILQNGQSASNCMMPLTVPDPIKVNEVKSEPEDRPESPISNHPGSPPCNKPGNAPDNNPGSLLCNNPGSPPDSNHGCSPDINPGKPIDNIRGIPPATFHDGPPMHINVESMDVDEFELYNIESRESTERNKEKKPDTATQNEKCKNNSQAMRRLEPGSRLCYICGKSYPTIYSMRYHMLLHTDVFQFKCSECPYRGKTQMRLHQHEKVHLGRKLVCPYCAHSFNDRSNMKKHIINTHESKPVQCGECGNTISNQQQLKKHIKQTHNSHPVTCQICGKQYKSEYYLKKHRYKTHRIRLKLGHQASYLLASREKT